MSTATASIEYDPTATERSAERILEAIASRIHGSLPDLVQATYDTDQTSKWSLSLSIVPATTKKPMTVEIKSSRSLPEPDVTGPASIRDGKSGPQLMLSALEVEFE